MNHAPATLAMLASSSLALTAPPDGPASEDRLDRLARRPAGVPTFTTSGLDDARTVWIGDEDAAWRPGLFADVARTRDESPDDVTRTSIGLATDGRWLGRPNDLFGLVTTVDLVDRSLERALDPDAASIGLTHGWRPAPGVRVQTTVGWRPWLDGPPVAFAGIALGLEF